MRYCLCLLQIYMHNRQDITETNLKPALLDGKDNSDLFTHCFLFYKHTWDEISTKRNFCLVLISFDVVLCQPSARRLSSWTLRLQRLHGTGAGWLWSESRKRKPDWACWVRISPIVSDPACLIVCLSYIFTQIDLFKDSRSQRFVVW